MLDCITANFVVKCKVERESIVLWDESMQAFRLKD